MTRVSDWIDTGLSDSDRGAREIIAGRAAMQTIGARAAPGLPMSDDAVDRMILRVARQLYAAEWEGLIDPDDTRAVRNGAFRFGLDALVDEATKQHQEDEMTDADDRDENEMTVSPGGLEFPNLGDENAAPIDVPPPVPQATTTPGEEIAEGWFKQAQADYRDRGIVRCPACLAGGRTSRVTQRQSTSGLVHRPTTYDEQGRPHHAHTPITTTFHCSNGHRFSLTR